MDGKSEKNLNKEGLKKERLSEDDIYLRQIPVIDEKIEVKKDNDTVYIILKNNNKIQSFFRRVGFKIPKTTTVELDEYSSYVFLQINNHRSIYEIGQILKDNKGDVEPLYDRLVIYFDFLKNQKKWISYK